MGFLATFLQKVMDLEWEYATNSNQFVLVQSLMSYYGLRFDQAPKVLRRALWCLHRLVVALIYANIFYKAYWELTQMGYGLMMLHVISYIWILSGALLRVWIYQRPIRCRLEHFLNDQSFCGDEDEIFDARRLLQLRNNRYLVIVIVVMHLEALVFLATKLMNDPTCMIVYKGRVVGGLVVQLIYGWVTCYWGSLYVIVFGFLYVMLNAFRHEMSILVHSFERINRHLLDFQHVQDSTVASVLGELKFWNELRALLKKNVQRHVELLDNLSSFRSILGPFSFVQYYGTFVLIAYYSFIMTTHGVNKDSLVYCGFTIFLVVESFLFCRIIMHLNDMHAKIGRIVYDLEWPGQLRFSPRFASEYRHVRTSLLIIMARTQAPLPCTLIGHGTISMSRFVDLMNSSYSFLALLLRVNPQVGRK